MTERDAAQDRLREAMMKDAAEVHIRAEREARDRDRLDGVVSREERRSGGRSRPADAA